MGQAVRTSVALNIVGSSEVHSAFEITVKILIIQKLSTAQIKLINTIHTPELL